MTILREVLGVNAFVATAIDLTWYRIGMLLQNQPTCLEFLEFTLEWVKFSLDPGDSSSNPSDDIGFFWLEIA